MDGTNVDIKRSDDGDDDSDIDSDSDSDDDDNDDGYVYDNEATVAADNLAADDAAADDYADCGYWIMDGGKPESLILNAGKSIHSHRAFFFGHGKNHQNMMRTSCSKLFFLLIMLWFLWFPMKMWYINPINYDVDDFRRFKHMNSRAATLPRYPRLCWKVFFGHWGWPRTNLQQFLKLWWHKIFTLEENDIENMCIYIYDVNILCDQNALKMWF